MILSKVILLWASVKTPSLFQAKEQYKSKWRVICLLEYLTQMTKCKKEVSSFTFSNCREMKTWRLFCNRMLFQHDSERSHLLFLLWELAKMLTFDMDQEVRWSDLIQFDPAKLHEQVVDSFSHRKPNATPPPPQTIAKGCVLFQTIYYAEIFTKLWHPDKQTGARRSILVNNGSFSLGVNHSFLINSHYRERSIAWLEGMC